MTTLENTISMIQVLPEIDLLKVQDFARRLAALKKESCPFTPLAKDDIIKDLARSEKEVEKREAKSAVAVIGDLKNEYGL